MAIRRSVLVTLTICFGGQIGCSDNAASARHQLLVHTGMVQTAQTGSQVFLGDGSVFTAMTDNQGDVLFRDDRLTLPQDVTWVQTSADSPLWALAQTIVGVDASEIWLYDTSDSLPPTTETLVTGDVTPHSANTHVVGGGGDFWATSDVYANGYALNLRGTTAGTIDVVAWDTQLGAPGGVVTAVGVARDVPIVRNANTKQDIALDHSATPSFVVSALNDSGYGGADSATLGFSFASLPLWSTATLFSNSVLGALPASVSTPSMDGPLAALRRTLVVASSRAADGRDVNGIDPAQFNGSCSVENVDAAATQAEVMLMTPAAMTTPVLGKLATPGTAPLDNLTFTWTDDPKVLFTRLTVSSGGAYNTNPRWEVYVPGSQTTYTFPAFTAQNGVTVLNTTTTYQVEVESYAYSQVPAATDLWTNASGPGHVPFGDTCSTYQTGFLELQ